MRVIAIENFHFYVYVEMYYLLSLSSTYVESSSYVESIFYLTEVMQENKGKMEQLGVHIQVAQTISLCNSP